ncbi:GGDEF domain-containing protein [Noviherbaspirillum pedocola]|uniref:diguanylate cyclase n=1 Tax=Noviherbaspirillum pedocola TaxID=2801341 RepID=A0A934W1I3_9BURK|nr:GGDEF domain-containing protein [Noviherbaspirillum pedocola]MBK4735206.1 GGDEF domain-containing protein [Noviherbaspirillum pedocola]
MLSTKEIFLIASLLCFVSYLILFSFREDGVKGIRQLLLASVLGMAGNILYAYGRELSPLFAFEIANTVYASAPLAVFVGYRHLFGRRTPSRPLFLLLALFCAGISFFHYVVDSFSARTMLASMFQAGVALAIGHTVLSRRAAWHKPLYPKVFILSMCALVAGGHLFRALWQLYGTRQPVSLLEPSGWNVILLAAGGFALPVLIFGALLIAHRRIVLMAEYAANHDFLTGVWSRRAFFEMGEHELARAGRTGLPMSLLLVDLDNFKAVNDTQGHDRGDQVLMEFVSHVRHELRVVDSLCRLGGDEFAVLMPDTDLPGAAALAARLRAKVDMARERMAGVTLSIGVATLRDRDIDLKALIKRADIALYAAKERGRNRVFLEQEGTLPLVVKHAA